MMTHVRRTVVVFFITLGKLWVRSTHGLISTAPAGWGSPMSLSTVRAERHSPAPAESPAKTSFDVGTALWGAPGGGDVR